jgi:hypothetical protein
MASRRFMFDRFFPIIPFLVSIGMGVECSVLATIYVPLAVTPFQADLNVTIVTHNRLQLWYSGLRAAIKIEL